MESFRPGGVTLSLWKLSDKLENFFWRCVWVREGTGSDVCSRPTEASVESNEQLTDAEGDGGVSRDDDGFVSTFGVSAVVDLKLQHNRKHLLNNKTQNIDLKIIFLI